MLYKVTALKKDEATQVVHKIAEHYYPEDQELQAINSAFALNKHPLFKYKTTIEEIPNATIVEIKSTVS